MSGRIRYTEEFKKDAVCQVTDRGYLAVAVSCRLGVSTKSMYDWLEKPASGRRLAINAARALVADRQPLLPRTIANS